MNETANSLLEMAFHSHVNQLYIDFLAIPLQALVTTMGSVLHILIVWVLSSCSEFSYMDVLQMNLSVCDVVIGLSGLAAVIGSRITKSYTLFRFGLFSAATAIYHEDWTVIMTMICRNKQVSNPESFLLVL